MKVINLLSRYLGLPLLACLLAGLLVSALSIVLLQKYEDSQARAELTGSLGKLQEYLLYVTTRNKAMGIAVLQGLNEPIFKRAARDELVPDAPEVLQRLTVARKHFGFEGIYIIDKTGRVVAHDTDNRKITGDDVSFRPYYRRGIQGNENVYLAIGTVVPTRGLFVAAPIHETDDVNTPVIGVISIKITLDESLNDVLKGAGTEALLISPQGVVFSATNKDWLMKMTSPYSEERVNAIRTVMQFGHIFDKTNPVLLDFDPGQPLVGQGGKRFIVEHTSIDWHDPAGSWMAVLMEDSEKRLPAARKAKIIGLIMLLALAIGFIVEQQLRRIKSLNERLAAENVQRAKAQEDLLAAAEERTLIARVVAELRQVQGYTELVQVFMRHASQLLDIHYGLFYVADAEQQQLRIIGGYGLPTSDIGKKIPYGEGLAGQCAIEKIPVQLTHLPADYIHINSGTGSASPASILLRPLILKDNLAGVLELASFSSLTTKQEEMLQEFEVVVAANVELIKQRLSLEQEFLRQKASEADLRYKTLLHQTLIDAIPYPMFYKGADSRFLGFNRAYEQVFNTNREQLVGKRVLDLDYLPEADRKAYQEEDERVIRQVESTQREMLIPFADGKLHKTLYCVSGFYVEGRPGGLVGIFIDLSDHTKED